MPAIMMILTNIMLQVGMITLVQSTKAKERTVDEDSRIAYCKWIIIHFLFNIV